MFLHFDNVLSGNWRFACKSTYLTEYDLAISTTTWVSSK